MINNICKKNNLKICVAPVSSRKEKIKKIFPKDEINFYEKNGLKFDYIFDQSYKIANRSKVIFCIDSNLGYELIAKKHKVFFFNSKNNIYLKKYPFITNKLDNNFEKLFLKLIYLNNIMFNKIIKKSKIKFFFDKKNKIIKKHIEKIINIK